MTQYVIEQLKIEFQKQQADIDLYNIDNILSQNIPIENYDIMGIAYPVHSFNAPEIVINFANKLPIIKSMNVFIISTAGEKNAANQASSKLLLKILFKKGCNAFYDRQFIMPSNFVIKYDKTKVEQLISQVNSKIPETADEIINHVEYKQQSGIVTKCIAFVGRVEWFGAKCIGKFFYANKACNRCGVCANNCPNHNIIVNKESVSFKWNCGLCMRCLYICPRHSIKIHQPFKFIRFDHWYEDLELPMIKK